MAIIKAIIAEKLEIQKLRHPPQHLGLILSLHVPGEAFRDSYFESAFIFRTFAEAGNFSPVSSYRTTSSLDSSFPIRILSTRLAPPACESLFGIFYIAQLLPCFITVMKQGMLQMSPWRTRLMLLKIFHTTFACILSVTLAGLYSSSTLRGIGSISAKIVQTCCWHFRKPLWSQWMRSQPVVYISGANLRSRWVRKCYMGILKPVWTQFGCPGDLFDVCRGKATAKAFDCMQKEALGRIIPYFILISFIVNHEHYSCGNVRASGVTDFHCISPWRG